MPALNVRADLPIITAHPFPCLHHAYLGQTAFCVASSAGYRLGQGQLDSLAKLGAQMSTIRRDVHMPEKEKKRLLAQLQEQTGAIGQQMTEKSEKQRSARLVEASNEVVKAAQEAGVQIAAPETAPAATDGSTGEAQPASATQEAASPAPAAAQGGAVAAAGSGADAGGGQPLGSIVDNYA